VEESQAAADVVVDVEAVPFDDWVGRRSEEGKTKKETRASRDGKDEDAPFSSPDADDVDARAEDSAADALDDDAFGFENEGFFGRDRSTRPRANERARGDRRDAYGTYETGGYDRWASVSRNALDDAARLASSALGVDGAGRGGRTVAGSSSGERENRWREFLTGRFYGAFQEDVVPVRFARDARNAMDETDPLAAGANEDSRERTNRVATAERRKKTASDVPADGRFVDGAWIDDGAENGDDVGGSPSFGSSPSSASSDGEGGDGDEPLGTAR
jgi:hypothetical protein